MEQIIQQIIQECTKNMMEILTKRESYDLDGLAGDLLEESKNCGRRVLLAFLKEINQEIRENKDLRRKEGLVVQQRNRPREYLTLLGNISWTRDYYYSKKTNTFVVPMDEFLHVEKRQRIGTGISIGLVTNAASVSYSKSAAVVTNGAVSKQTVHNHILKTKIPDIPPDKQPKKVKEIHVFADEDHVHLQGPKGARKKKRCRIVPLVTVTEGIEPVGKARNQTICPMHFVDENFSASQLWKSVSGYISAVYQTDDIQKVCLHSDGGSWIRNGLEMFPGTVRIMDGFHFYEHLKSVSSRFPGQNIRDTILETIRSHDFQKAVDYLRNLEKPVSKPVHEFEQYLRGNWSMIRERILGNHPGSCTEPLVSHILSERFSRNPMGWSDQGLGKLSKIRVFLQNGGKIAAEHFIKQPSSFDYGNFFDDILTAHQESILDWSIFESSPSLINPAAPMQKLIHHIVTHN